jgi:hypothetical protein
MRTYHFADKCIPSDKKAMTYFLSDWWEVFVISGCYEMGDPLAPSEVEGNREGGGLPACPAPKRGS